MFGSDGSPIIQYVVIFAVIFTALAAIVFVVRRLTGRGLALPGRAGTRGRQPRLGIVDVYELDRARQLILLRRDNVEHLLLVGGPNDVVVERNIQRGQRPMPEASLRPAEPMAEPLPDPLAGAGRLPEPQRALAEVAAQRVEPAFDPGFPMPVVVRPPIPGSGTAPPVTLPLDAGLIGGDEPGQDIPAERRAPPPQPARTPAPAEPAARETSAPRRVLQRTPPLLAPKPEPASERARDADADRTAAPAPRMPPLTVSGERRPVDPAVLSDMARQLQAALARPASAVAPPPATPEPSPEPSPMPAVDPVAAAMAAAPATAAPEPPRAAEPAASEPPAAAAVTPLSPPPPSPPPPVSVPPNRPDAPRTAVPGPSRPVPPPAQAPVQAPAQAIPRAPAQAPAPAPRAETPAPEPAAPTPPPAKAGNNPFSVEEIEAEFARLLGRPLDKRG